jgi:hypothetical protein
MYFLQEITPNTSAYMIAGYVVIFGVILIYLTSLAIRRRNLKQDLEMLEELDRSSAIVSGANSGSQSGAERSRAEEIPQRPL